MSKSSARSRGNRPASGSSSRSASSYWPRLRKTLPRKASAWGSSGARRRAAVRRDGPTRRQRRRAGAGERGAVERGRHWTLVEAGNEPQRATGTRRWGETIADHVRLSGTQRVTVEGRHHLVQVVALDA